MKQIQNEITESAHPPGSPSATPGNVLILPVMVQADAYPEVTEERLRARVAVLEALGMRGYKPLDTVHVGYFSLKWPKKRFEQLPDSDYSQVEKIDSKPLDLLVPYEWCESKGVPMAGSTLPVKQYDRVLILWVNENVFYDYPATRLGWLLQAVIPSCAGVDVAIVGPYGSTTLRAMVKESAEISKRGAPIRPLALMADQLNPAATVHMVSPWATVCDEALGLGTSATLGEGSQSVDSYLTTCVAGHVFPCFKFERANHTDLELCQELVAELYRRNVDVPTGAFWGKPTRERRETSPPISPASQEPAIALISEWDTVYGRALPLTFAAAASGHTVTDLVKDPGNFPNWIKSFVYLRGLDGKTTANASGASSDDGMPGDGESPKADMARASMKLGAPVEQPEGTNQSDYLRRLAGQLSAWSNQLERNGRHLNAVGVLGTDLYDKLMVMRAVRDRLPSSVVFFTTDLDARYNLPAEWKTSHNLVVCSSYGLRLHRYYQGNIPTFRDSLQTAAYTATLRAVDPGGFGGSSKDWDWKAQLGKPRIHEIGRTSAFNMSVDAAADPPPPNSELDSQYFKPGVSPPTLQPPRYDLDPWFGGWQSVWGWLTALAVVITPCWIGWKESAGKLKRHPEIVSDERGWRWQMFQKAKFHMKQQFIFLPSFCAITGSLIWIIIGEFVWTFQREQAPFAWFEGVSIWPTEAMRLFVFFLCIHFFFKADEDLRSSNRQIERIFGLKRTPGLDAASEPGKEPKRSGRGLARIADRVGRNGVRADLLWNEYLDRSDTAVRFKKMLKFTALAAIAVALLFLIFGPPRPPIRGHAVVYWDWAMTLLGVGSAGFLTLYVVDGTILNTSIISVLVKHNTIWEESKHRPMHLADVAHSELTEYYDIQFIAMRTEVVGQVIYYPFFVFLLLVLGRLSIFDNWDWAVSMLIIYAGNIGLALWAATRLRHCAEAARESAMRMLRERQIKCLEAKDQESKAEAFKLLREMVKSEKTGAFSVLSQYPLLASILLPSGGVGLWVILEQLCQTFAGSQ